MARFHGVYEGADEPDRDFFVAKASHGPGVDRTIPDGYIMIGAMWGDVAPWFMKSVSELEFIQAYTNPGQDPIGVKFEVDGDGNAVAMTFTEGIFTDRGRVERIGDLPEGW